MRGNKDFLALM